MNDLLTVIWFCMEINCSEFKTEFCIVSAFLSFTKVVVRCHYEYCQLYLLSLGEI